mmetsp:Transcript_22637/g.48713  ORF Transcript_22637/g.48713 Transcript_22637/m.48713 type:complete len:531 (+) Transcript_22637:42-1634(+)
MKVYSLARGQALAALLASIGGGLSFSSTPRAFGRPKGIASHSTTAKANEEEMDASSLPLPPSLGMNLYRNVRDTLSYLSDSDRFVADRSGRLGPIFMGHLFFKPTVFCGGQEAVKEFITSAEAKASVTHPDLPESFMDLHTKWGALNMDISEPMFKELRALFGDTLSSREALDRYSIVAEKEIQTYVDELTVRVRADPEQPTYLAAELKSLCLQMFAKIFSGRGLTNEQEQQFIDYNAALLSLSKNSNQYRKGVAALEDLRVEMLRRFRSLDDPNLPADTPGKWYHDQIFGRPNFDDEERISTEIILFIWGAYVECASLMADALALAHKNDIDLGRIREEHAARRASGLSPSDPAFWKAEELAYTNGILRESLRLYPPGAGVPRFGYEEFALAGYRIPAGMPVMLEPRVGNRDPDLYADPENFEPLRWVPPEAAEGESGCPFQGTALRQGLGSWFPGGHGAHQCPGVPLAEMVGRIFLTKMSVAFDSWTFNGEGLTKNGDIKYVKIPVRIPPDNFGMLFKLKDESTGTSL